MKYWTDTDKKQIRTTTLAVFMLCKTRSSMTSRAVSSPERGSDAAEVDKYGDECEDIDADVKEDIEEDGRRGKAV